MYQRILLTVDGSDNAFRAAQEAIKLAKLSETSTIDIVYVVNVDKIKNELLIAGTIDRASPSAQNRPS